MKASTFDEQAPVLFAHVVWMEQYRGELLGLYPGTWRHRDGRDPKLWHERWNFEPDGGYYYGSCFHWDNKNDVFARLAVSHLEEDSVSVARGVTVLFTAKHPETRRRVVVGWYKNADVFASLQKGPRRGRGYFFRTRVGAGRLLDYDDRVVEVGTAQRNGKGHPGQDPVFYASRKNPKLARQVLRKLSELNSKRPSSKPPRSVDPERRALVEDAAMRATMSLLEKSHWKCEDVSKHCRGWDIEARLGKQLMCVEVKGLSNSALVAELTPNEFKMLMRHARGRMGKVTAISLVNNALTRPKVHLFRWRQDTWVDSDLNVLSVTKRVGAILRKKG